MRYSIFLLLIGSVYFSNCERTGDCAQPAGHLKRITVAVDSFRSVAVYQDIELQIIPSAKQHVEVEFGENLFDDLHFTVEEGKLTLKNFTRCNWVHSFLRPKVYVYTSTLDYLGQFGSGLLSASDTLRCDKLHLEITDGSGDIQLTVKANELSIVTNGTSNIYLNGKVNTFAPQFYWNNGRLYADQLKATNVVLGHFGYNDLYVYADAEISGTIENSGNVFYKGNPQTSVKETWTGKLIKLN